MGWFDFLDPLTNAIEQWLVSIGVTVPPFSGIFLLFVSLILSSITGLLNRTLLDMDELAKKSEEMKKHQDLKKKERKTTKFSQSLTKLCLPREVYFFHFLIVQ